MFGGQRFKTKGINRSIPHNIQMIIWHILDVFLMNNSLVDYLQIFEILINENEQTISIIHKQEQPEYEKTYHFKIPSDEFSSLKENKIYIIDNGDYITMLLTDEY